MLCRHLTAVVRIAAIIINVNIIIIICVGVVVGDRARGKKRSGVDDEMIVLTMIVMIIKMLIDMRVRNGRREAEVRSMR